MGEKLKYFKLFAFRIPFTVRGHWYRFVLAPNLLSEPEQAAGDKLLSRSREENHLTAYDCRDSLPNQATSTLGSTTVPLANHHLSSAGWWFIPQPPGAE